MVMYLVCMLTQCEEVGCVFASKVSCPFVQVSCPFVQVSVLHAYR
jgi:hypothetical protein